jgi:hypothetical protein
VPAWAFEERSVAQQRVQRSLGHVDLEWSQALPKSATG